MDQAPHKKTQQQPTPRGHQPLLYSLGSTLGVGGLVYGHMRDRSGPTGLGDGPPIGGLGLKFVVGSVGRFVEMGFVWGAGREGGWVRVGLVVRGHIKIPPAARSLEVSPLSASSAAASLEVVLSSLGREGWGGFVCVCVGGGGVVVVQQEQSGSLSARAVEPAGPQGQAERSSSRSSSLSVCRRPAGQQGPAELGSSRSGSPSVPRPGSLPGWTAAAGRVRKQQQVW
jgi:hypothetical protein